MKIINYVMNKFYQLKLKDKLINNTLESEPSEQDYVMSIDEVYPIKHVIQHSVPIRSQGSIGSCMSHATIRAVEIQMKPEEFIEGSELYHYYMARKYVNKQFPKDKGMTVIDGCKTVYKYGICPEELWKYETEKYNNDPDIFANSFAEFLKHWYPIEGYYRVTSINDIKTALSNDLPIVFGLRIDSNYRKCTGKWTPGGSYLGGHAQLIYGYNEEYFFIENSWGTRWGAKGKYIAKIEDIMDKGFDFMVIKLKDD